MTCQTRMSIIQPPTTYVYSVFFIVGGIFATITNLLVLIILCWPGRRLRSNKILISLALSDFLVGCIVFPITGYQVLDYPLLNDCVVDFARAYFTVFLSGSSCLTLAVISYDRYILMTKLHIYDRKTTKRMMVTLIALSWIVPGLSPFIKWIGSLPYLVVTMVILIGPFFVLLFNYFCITNALKKQEKKLKNRYLESIQMKKDSLSGDGVDINYVDTSFRVTYRKERSDIKLAKSVLLLILTYFCCVAPINIWIILDLANTFKHFMSSYFHQNFYLFTLVTILWNSCLNPIVYLKKNPEIRKGFKKIFKIKENNENSFSN